MSQKWHQSKGLTLSELCGFLHFFTFIFHLLFVNFENLLVHDSSTNLYTLLYVTDQFIVKSTWRLIENL